MSLLSRIFGYVSARIGHTPSGATVRLRCLAVFDAGRASVACLPFGSVSNAGPIQWVTVGAPGNAADTSPAGIRYRGRLFPDDEVRVHKPAVHGFPELRGCKRLQSVLRLQREHGQRSWRMRSLVTAAVLLAVVPQLHAGEGQDGHHPQPWQRSVRASRSEGASGGRVRRVVRESVVN